MQLITGGNGFIGLNVARALLELGEPCVLTTSHPDRRPPQFIHEQIGKQVFIERLDLTDRDAFVDLKKRYAISGVIHLAGAVVGRGSVRETFDEARAALLGWTNALFAASEWGVSRVSVASTIGVYAGAGDGPFHESMPLPVLPTHPIPMSKKIFEMVGLLLAGRAGLQIVNLRIGGVWGPLFHHPASPVNIASRMIRASAKGEAFDPSPALHVFAEDGSDLCYVKDLGRAIALLQLAGRLNHTIYNVGTGRVVKNGEFVAAIRRNIPAARIDMVDGFDPNGPGKNSHMDTTRLRADTGFEPAFDVERGVADYVAWLRAGNQH